MCQLGDKVLEWKDDIEEIKEAIPTCNVLPLVKLPEFLAHFYDTWSNLNRGELKILDKTYTPSPDLKSHPHLWNQVMVEMEEELQKIIQEKDPQKIRFEPPFILGLKALLKVLGQSLSQKEKEAS